MSNYVVYQHVNKINKKRYIGLSKNYKNRWDGRGCKYQNSPIFYNAIKKYGWDNFQHNIIKNNLNQKQAQELEITLIKQYNTTDRKYGYNFQLGGNLGWAGKKHTEETRKKMSKKQKGKNNNNARSVICIQTGQYFETCVEAAEKMNLGTTKQTGGSTIARCAKGNRKTAYKYHWKYAGEKNNGL